jgi:hypothetical protein
MNAITQVQPVNGRGPCYRHPKVETGLRCSGCKYEHFICPRCAVLTPVGYKCPDCIRDLARKRRVGRRRAHLIAPRIAPPRWLAALGLSLLTALAFWLS